MQIKPQRAAFLLVLKGFKVDFSFNLLATVSLSGRSEGPLIEALLGSVRLNPERVSCLLTGNKIIVDTKDKNFNGSI